MELEEKVNWGIAILGVTLLLYVGINALANYGNRLIENNKYLLPHEKDEEVLFI